MFRGPCPTGKERVLGTLWKVLWAGVEVGMATRDSPSSCKAIRQESQPKQVAGRGPGDSSERGSRLLFMSAAFKADRVQGLVTVVRPVLSACLPGSLTCSASVPPSRAVCSLSLQKEVLTKTVTVAADCLALTQRTHVSTRCCWRSACELRLAGPMSAPEQVFVFRARTQAEWLTVLRSSAPPHRMQMPT